MLPNDPLASRGRVCILMLVYCLFSVIDVSMAQNDEGQVPSSRNLSLRYEGITIEPEAAKNEKGFWFINCPAPSSSLATDRPGFSDTYALVPRGYTHLEFGYSLYYDHEDSSRVTNHAIGEFSLRTGLTDNFELRIKWAGGSLNEFHGEGTSRFAGRNIHVEDHSDGATDMSVGFKAPLLKQKGWIPNLSIIPAISIPTGTTGKTTGDVDPEVRLAWNYSLTGKLSIYGVGLATWITDSDSRFFQSGASFATFYQFTPKVGGFLEYYGLYPNTRNSDCQHNLDFGPVFLINDNFQIDVRAGVGLNEEAPDFQAGIGFCYRF